MIKLLSIILFLLLAFVGGIRGIKTFFTIYLNLALIFILVIITGWGFNPIIPTFIICIIISIMILFFLNGVNHKTKASFISVLLLLVLFFAITCFFNNRIYTQGYTEETIDSVGYVVAEVGVDMKTLANCVIMIGLIGNIVDTSIAISSSLYEVHVNNPKLSKKELFLSGMNVGKDILGTTTNTLFFAYLGGFMSLFLYFYGMSIGHLLNSKVFAIEFTRIMLSGIASFLIIPITAVITSGLCKRVKKI